MKLHHSIVLFSAALVCIFSSALALDIPASTDPRFSMQLVAQEPEIVTPTGLAVDARGRVWVIENNTHFTPKNYKGFASDRIQILDDFASDGRARKFTTFASGFKNSMTILLDKTGGVYFGTRSEIILMHEQDGVEKLPAERKTLISLDTAGNYPHNGLSGLAFGPDGWLYFSLGENLGADYKITGSDGSTLSGGGEGGNIYRCTLEGGKLEKIATGFWNAFGLGFDQAGRMFAVDNDPDSRPPCRLLHIVKNGDYGFRFRYGRKGIHPFVAWNGEIPGILPMVSGTGEAPCAVYVCGSNFPADYHGNLLVTSWGDHVIQRFQLIPDGASFHALPETLIKGGVEFRPVGLVPAPDGSLLISDWVSSSYPVHGKGRVWRLRVKEGSTAPLEAAHEKSPADANLRSAPLKSLLLQLSTPDPFKFHFAVDALSDLKYSADLLQNTQAPEPRVRLGVLLALRKSANPAGRAPLPQWLNDPDIPVRRAAVQWVGEEHLKEFEPQLDAVTKTPMTRDLFLAYLASKSLLSGDKPDKGEYIESQMAQIFPSDKHAAHFRALALKNLRVDHPGMSVPILLPLLAHKDAELRGEAIRALSLHPHPAAQIELRKLALDDALSQDLRAMVLSGLARSAAEPETKTLLMSVVKTTPDLVLRREAMRALRGAAADKVVQDAVCNSVRSLPPDTELRSEMGEQAALLLKLGGVVPAFFQAGIFELIAKRPLNEAEWLAAIAQKNPVDNPAAGERIFYQVKGAGCFNCHAINGRGGKVGPDLTTIGKTIDKNHILQSILDPAREVAPQFVPWTFVMKDGRRLTGTIIEENDGFVILGDSSAVVTKFKLLDVDYRAAQKGSVMPDNLLDLLTQQELRDLLAYFQSL